MNQIEDFINKVLKHWNEACKEHELDQEFIVDFKCRKKKFYLNRNDFYEQRIAEISLFVKGNPTLLLWRKEKRMPEKVKGIPQHRIDADYKDDLYTYLLYEATSNFCHTTRSLIMSKDYAEYDIEKDRLKPDVSANGMIVCTNKAGAFYEANNDFDVFMVVDNGYHVYTAHDLAKRSNGILKIAKDDCYIKELPKPRILTLDELSK